MGEITVKDNVRYTAKDANRVDIVPVQTKVAVEGSDLWAKEQADAARAELQAELDGIRQAHDADLAKRREDLDAELTQRRAEFERELEAARAAEPQKEAAVNDGADVPAGETEQTDDTATKVAEPEVKKVREPSTTKSRTSGTK